MNDSKNDKIKLIITSILKSDNWAEIKSNNETKSLNLFITGKWGIGKTTFVKGLKDIFLELDNEYYTIFIDAWSIDFLENPLLTLSNKILEQIQKKDKLKKETRFWKKDKILKKIVQKLIKISKYIGKQFFNTVLSKFGINIDINKILQIIKNNDNIDQLQKNVNDFSQQLNKLINKSNKKIIIFIDELDRCNPVFSLKVLEFSKHIFQNSNIAIVFSINKNQWENLIFNTWGYTSEKNECYLSKIMDYEFPLDYNSNANKMTFNNLCINNSSFLDEINILKQMIITINNEERTDGKEIKNSEERCNSIRHIVKIDKMFVNNFNKLEKSLNTLINNDLNIVKFSLKFTYWIYYTNLNYFNFNEIKAIISKNKILFDEFKKINIKYNWNTLNNENKWKEFDSLKKEINEFTKKLKIKYKNTDFNINNVYKEIINFKINNKNERIINNIYNDYDEKDKMDEFQELLYQFMNAIYATIYYFYYYFTYGLKNLI